jgi:hypothetical protein
MGCSVSDEQLGQLCTEEHMTGGQIVKSCCAQSLIW